MLDWVRRYFAGRKEHKRAWALAGMAVAGRSSPFQDECVAALARACAHLSIPIPQLERRGTEDPYLTGTLADGRTLYINRDGAELGPLTFEAPDYATPADLCLAFERAVTNGAPTGPAPGSAA